MDEIDQAVEAIEQAQGALIDALEAYREVLRARIDRERASARPNPKRTTLYQRGIGEIEGALGVLDTLFADKVLLILNRRFILHQAESPSGMVRLGMLTDS
ncbi:MAG: hypothetical protein HY690_04530 [Chloroflexi bacterium]|nr:hypothetical protein [Chloroflexota bacterium]